MQTNFFNNVNDLNIGGGTFTMNSRPDYSTNTTNYNTVRTINDNSRHTTNYGTYTNYGQHATDQGQINNYGPQTTNNGPISGYRQHGMNHWPGRSPSSYAYGQSSYAPPGRPYLQPGRIPSDKAGQPKKDFDPSSPEFEQEYNGMTPKMKAYLRNLGFDRDRVGNWDALNRGRANIPDDSVGPQRFNHSPAYGHHTPADPPFWNGRKAAHRPSSRDFDEEELPDAEYLDVIDERAAVFNDNRVVTTNINSNNVNTTNVHDSYNDNSTRTDITKSAR